jgi:hypothetical protein
MSKPPDLVQGIIPEYSIQPTIQQLLTDSDPTLDRAIGIVETARSESSKGTQERK